jgi:methyltransferase (TIGR00027 family)
MRTGHASRTAEHNALFRALETMQPRDRRLFDDALARGFLTWPLTLVGHLAIVPGARAAIRWFIDARWPGVRSSVVARTALIDDAVCAAIDEGARQLVILGAGFDTRAHRLPGVRGIPVFEVDHPNTQRAKQDALRRALGVVPREIRYVRTDFNQAHLDEAMVDAGYDTRVRTVLVWEGVSNYLTEDAVDTTLRWCARSAPGSTLIFTYIHRDVLTDPRAFVGTDRLFATLATVGEQFTFGIDPTSLPGFLAERGLALERDLGAADYRRLYLRDADHIRGHEFYRVAVARVAGWRDDR